VTQRKIVGHDKVDSARDVIRKAKQRDRAMAELEAVRAEIYAHHHQWVPQAKREISIVERLLTALMEEPPVI
jgi:hypothetical protein